MIKLKAPVESTNEDTRAVRGEIAGLHERVTRIESLLLGLYGSQALGSPEPAPGKPPPAESARAMKPIATFGGPFSGS